MKKYRMYLGILICTIFLIHGCSHEESKLVVSNPEITGDVHEELKKDSNENSENVSDANVDVDKGESGHEKTEHLLEHKTNDTSKDSESPTVNASTSEVNGKTIMEEQSFDIDLNEWGKVRFVSCAPKDTWKTYEETKQYEDVSFYLMKDGNEVYSFPEPENIPLESWVFDDISFVTFKDINQDNYKDVIIGVNYYVENGPSANEPFHSIRIYMGKEGEFESKDQLADSIPYEYSDASSVVNYIKGKVSAGDGTH